MGGTPHQRNPASTKAYRKAQHTKCHPTSTAVHECAPPLESILSKTLLGTIWFFRLMRFINGRHQKSFSSHASTTLAKISPNRKGVHKTRQLVDSSTKIIFSNKKEKRVQEQAISTKVSFRIHDMFKKDTLLNFKVSVFYLDSSPFRPSAQ
jgi:hypothetical protein